MTVKMFATAVNAANPDRSEFLEFGLPDLGHTPERPRVRTMKAYKPDGAQFAVLMAMMGAGRKPQDRISAVINFVIAVLEPDDADYIQSRLLDPFDGFGLEEINDIITWMTEEWSGNPTEGQSDSVSSQPRTGPNSTQRISL